MTGEPTKVYKMVLLFVDHDQLGPEETKALLEDTRYPNHIIGPTVMSMETREVMWNDDHPLNSVSGQRAAFEALFGRVARDEEIDRLRKEHDDATAESDRAYQLFPPLLKGVCDALKGPPPPLVSYDWSDLPAVAARIVAERDTAVAEVARLSALLDRVHDLWKVGGYVSPSATEALATIAKMLAETAAEAKNRSGR
jgi:hypothetical protein